MPEPFDFTRQPEFAGPLTEPRASGGVMLDVQALAQGTVRLPQLNEQALAAGDYVPRSAGSPFIEHTADFINAERAAAYDRDSLRAEIQQAAYRGIRDGIEARNITARATAEADATVRAVMTDELADAEPAKEAAE
jgi:hypothetical protein